MAFLTRWLRGGNPPERPAERAYRAVIDRARAPHWYLQGGVPDTIDGRFDMVAAVLAMLLLRLETSPDGAQPAADLAECFVEDMDGQLREIGFGDIVVGKHVGRMMGMLGGRLGAYRDAVAADDRAALETALVRNLYRGNAPAPDQLSHVAAGLLAFRRGMDGVSTADLIAGHLP